MSDRLTKGPGYRDQKLLLQAFHAKELASCQLEPLNHSTCRWLTMAPRSLMFYMTFEDPPYGIARLAYFILVHYAPQWFTPRVRSTATEAPKVLFEG